MAPRKYAEDTKVPVVKTRGEIQKLLYDWGAEGVQWTDHWGGDPPKVQLRFIWPHEGVKLSARFDLVLDVEDLEDRSRTTYGELSDSRLEKNRKQWERTSHRLLFIWLKAALNAVDAGLIEATQVFMPFLEDASGRTLGEIVGANILQLPGINAQKLLTSGQ